jgi:hypothetical protein
MDTQTLHAALALAGQASNVREAATALRTQMAPLRVMVVDADDMRDEPPAASDERHHLYLGASDGHCWAVTNDLAQAAGLFIAVRT